MSEGVGSELRFVECWVGGTDAQNAAGSSSRGSRSHGGCLWAVGDEESGEQQNGSGAAACGSCGSQTAGVDQSGTRATAGAGEPGQTALQQATAGAGSVGGEGDSGGEASLLVWLVNTHLDHASAETREQQARVRRYFVRCAAGRWTVAGC